MKRVLITAASIGATIGGTLDLDEYQPWNIDSRVNHDKGDPGHTFIDGHNEDGEGPLDPATRPDKCYGIALADAVNFGPYQAGALIGLLKHQGQTGGSYQVITGISLGALNGYIMSLFTQEETDLAVEELRNFWLDLAQIKPFETWKGGFFYGFFFEKGLFDPQNLHNFIDEKFKDREVKQHINIGLADVLTGVFSSFDESHSNEEMLQILKASVTFSGISPAVEAFNSFYFSGNAIYENDVIAAINHCEKLGYAEEDIVIDSILGGNSQMKEWDIKGKNAFQVMERSAGIYKFYMTLHGVLRAKTGHSGVNFRYVIGPSFDMPSKIVPFDLGLEETKHLLRIGEADATREIKSLLDDPEEEITKRIKSSQNIFYFNKERQAKHEQKMREAFQRFDTIEK